MENHICCNVCKCIHHDSLGHCTAKEVKVGGADASCSNETCCDTFLSKE